MTEAEAMQLWELYRNYGILVDTMDAGDCETLMLLNQSLVYPQLAECLRIIDKARSSKEHLLKR